MITLLDCPKCGSLRYIGFTGLICITCNGPITPLTRDARRELLKTDLRARSHDLTKSPIKPRRKRGDPEDSPETTAQNAQIQPSNKRLKTSDI
jgi:hypothetical protein